MINLWKGIVFVGTDFVVRVLWECLEMEGGLVLFVFWGVNEKGCFWKVKDWEVGYLDLGLVNWTSIWVAV